MDSKQSLGDFVAFGNPRQVAQSFKRKAKACERAADWVARNVNRTDESVALTNILLSTNGYINLGADNIIGHIAVIAIATRSLYELNLQTRDIIHSTDGLRRWNGEAVTDQISIWEGIVELETTGDRSQAKLIVETELSRLHELRNKYSLPQAAPRSAGALANSHGLAKEHKALFKLFSKLVHPSSYLVNSPNDAASPVMRDILVIHAQIYAADTFSRIGERVEIPKEIKDKFV